MRLNTEIPEIPIRRHTHWFVGIRVRGNIGVAGGIVVTYIELSVRFRIMIDFGCRPQDHGRPAMRAAEGSAALGSGLSFFQNGHLLFCVLLEFTQKTGGYPPSLRKEICKHFVNGQKKSYCKENAIALETKYRVLWLGHMGFETLSQTCYGLIGIAQISTF